MLLYNRIHLLLQQEVHVVNVDIDCPLKAESCLVCFALHALAGF